MSRKTFLRVRKENSAGAELPFAIVFGNRHVEKGTGPRGTILEHYASKQEAVMMKERLEEMLEEHTEWKKRYAELA